ncbi:MAG: metallophosphoesterase [Gemmataceae bacterium]|nr:metallophosphoesterase [Gemmataceae bacterium]
MHRRTFLKAAAAAAVPTVPLAAGGYGLYEARAVRVERPAVAVPRLPAAFDGLRVAFLADLHHGPNVGLPFVAAVVRTTLTLNPDLILLGGDYCSRGPEYVGPCFEVLAGLSAPLGVYGVLGNHDHWHGLAETKAGFRSAGIAELTDAGVWLERGSSRLRLAGVDDLWCGSPNVAAALGDARADDACVVLSHNPDTAETLRDPRVGLVLSGHTHGGQVVIPGYGAPVVPSRYGEKYARGLVRAPYTDVYVSRGLGTSGPGVRLNSPPELTLMTLVPG